MPLSDSLKTLLLRGLLAGLIAGLLAGGVAFFIGEPHVEAAIAVEEAGSAAHEHGVDGAEPAGHSHGNDEAPLVSRTGQKGGLFLATALAGLALGAIFAAVAHFARRVTDLPGAALAIAIAAGGWLAIEAVPFFKYPANPPAVGDPETMSQRTWLWLASVVLGLLAVSAAAYIAKQVSARSLSIRMGAPLVAFLVLVGIGYVLLPGSDEVGPDFPATLLWEFRLSSLATQATLWISLGLVFAFLTERSDPDRPTNAAVAIGRVDGNAKPRPLTPP